MSKTKTMPMTMNVPARFVRLITIVCPILLVIGLGLHSLPFHMQTTATSTAAPARDGGAQGAGRMGSRHGSITIDGDPSDWTGTAPEAVDTYHISDYELIWNDAAYDTKPDPSYYDYDSDIDLTELRLTADGDNLYLLARFRDLTNSETKPPGPYIALAIDTDDDANDTEMNYIGEWADTTLRSARQYAEYNVEINHDDGVKVSTGGAWTSAGTNYYDNYHETVEANIDMNALGHPSHMRITVGIAANVWPDGVPWEVGDDTVSDMLDTVSHGDAYGELSDNDIDFSITLDTGDIMSAPNTPPTADQLAISPAAPTSADALSIDYRFDDADGDTESGSEIRWYRNGTLEAGYHNQTTLPATATSKGERWYCTVHPSDGIDFGELVTAPTVTVRNAVPTVANIAVDVDPEGEGVPAGSVSITYLLADHDGDRCTISVGYASAGSEYRAATGGDGGDGVGDGVSALNTSPEGVAHQYIWNAVADLGEGAFSNITVQITPEDEDEATGTPATSPPFDVAFATNTPPWVTALELFGESEAGGVWGPVVSVSYQLRDAEGDRCGLAVSYSMDGAIYRAATAAANGDGTSALTSSPSGILHTYIWDAKADLGSGEFADVALRLTPHDADDGEPGTTTSFGVDLQPPTLTAVEPHRTQTNRTVVLAVESDEDAYCRWSTTDQGYDAMSAADQFTNGEGGRLHSTTVTAPEGNTTYYISAVDPYGNTVKDTVTINVTVDPSGAGEDRIPPRIVTGPTILSTSDSAAVIVWTTDEPANSTLEYGTDTSYGSLETGRRATVQHSVTLTGLTPSTGYHVRVSATDAYGNGPTLSDDLSFTTNASGAGDTVDSDHDGVGDIADAFPTDPAASIDSDGDGAPDRWNDGRSAADSNSGLKLDAYPDDPERWEEATDAGSKADTDDDGGGLLGQLDDNALLLIIISVIVVSIIVMVVLNLKITSEKLLEKNYVKTVDRYEDVLEDLKELGVETNPFDDTLEQYKRKRP